MGDTRTVNQYELDQLSDAIDRMSNQADGVRGVVSGVQRRTNSLEKDIDAVKREFDAFRLYDEQQKELSRAKTQIVNVRQQVQEKFGINDDVRQYLTGILEASDLSLVRNRIISNCTERMMLACPEYWLAPCLVAISAWLDNNHELANKALHEAIKRDDEKTSLLFSLICRRIGRMSASAAWLERYLLIQDPRMIERKMITVLDAYSNGLFGPQSRKICAEKIKDWIEVLSEEPGFVEEQQHAWEESMLSMVPGDSINGSYPYSSRYCKNWAAFTTAMNEVALHQKLLDYFQGIFEKTTTNSVSLNSHLDELLENFITSYDNEELELRREERLLELIIEEKGRRDRAEMRFSAESKAMDEVIDFAQLLTSAAMHADQIKASLATQRLAIALSKKWILSAYDNVTLKIGNALPSSYDFEIEGWRSSIIDGSEESKSLESAKNYFDNECQREIGLVREVIWYRILAIADAAIAVFALIEHVDTIPEVCIVLAIAFCLMWYSNRKECESKRKEIRERYNETIKDAENMVRALFAERADYFAEIKEKEAVADTTASYIKDIEVGQYIATAGQRIITYAGE